ncbi:MAG: hypothetical protein ACK5AZ_09865 [Bryobacteraceae bacterium]
MTQDPRILDTLSTLSEGPGWNLETVLDSDSLDAMPARGVSVILCDQVAAGPGWRGVLRLIQAMSRPPKLILMAGRDGNSCLWAEAMRLGAFDVMFSPLDEHEVRWIVDYAHARWISEGQA